MLIDTLDKSSGFFLKPTRMLVSIKSDFQKIEIYEHEQFGCILMLDNSFQTSELDEFLFHESMTHIPILFCKKLKSALIIGGGDGGTLEEVSKYNTINEITLVEIDQKVIEVSKKYLGNICKNSFDDPRVQVIISEGYSYLKQNDAKYDLIILDLPDPNKDCWKLFTKEFYELVKKRINPGGIISLNIASQLFFPVTFGRMINTLRSVFSNVEFHSVDIPIYGGLCSFAICSCDISFEKINNHEFETISELKYFTSELSKSLSIHPKYALDAITQYPELITLDNQIINEETKW